MSKHPNVIVLGAPKCGTTSVYHYFRKHPEIFVPEKKELHYFATDVKPKNAADRKNYYAQFRDAYKEPCIADVNILYLYSKEAVKRINDELDDVKLVCMLRDPVDAVHSLHAQLLVTGNEDEYDMERAWALQQDRAQGRSLPKGMIQNPKILQYKDVFRYGNQIERVLKRFPREKIHVMFFWKFQQDTAREMHRLYRFLDIDDYTGIRYIKHNPSKKIRSRTVQRFLNDRDHFLRKAAAGVIRNDMLRSKIINAMKQLNRYRAARQPLSPDLKREILNAYLDDIGKLEEMLSIDLSRWRSVE